ncbi:MAG TPA: HAMP domain-containing sensor histidine kinase [Chloroflexota bacterium]|nr:HAMP domain-containing sensor histidine kinase [Chloroflexota bacterium]
MSRVAAPERRREAAQALARHVGAEDLIVFVRDPEVDALLPAPGFPQTLPQGRRWHAFLRACLAAGEHSGELLRPDGGTPTRACGIAADDGSVLMLLGGVPQPEAVDVVRALLPLLAAGFRGERLAVAAEGHAAMAREAARRAAALADVLALARVDVEVAARTREEFLAAAAHDLKNPLASIKGVAQLLHRRVMRGGTADAEQLLEGLANIDLTATRMADLIDQLLGVTRQNMEQPLALDRGPTDVVALARRVAAEAQGSTEAHQVRVEAAVPTLIGHYDATRLERALGNLLSNAIKYSPGGGSIVVSVADERRAGTSWAVVTVVDQGIGIPPEDLERVFDRFQRGSNVVGQIGGTGIGLATVRRVVEAHGGTVSVTSQVGQGSQFTLRLPRGDADSGGLPSDATGATSVPRGRAEHE